MSEGLIGVQINLIFKVPGEGGLTGGRVTHRNTSDGTPVEENTNALRSG